MGIEECLIKFKFGKPTNLGPVSQNAMAGLQGMKNVMILSVFSNENFRTIPSEITVLVVNYFR